MSARIVLVLALLLGITLGTAIEPDSGTQAAVGAPDIHGLVLGANHAKPLPTVTSVAELLGLLGLVSATLLALALVIASTGAEGRFVRVDVLDAHRSVFRSLTRPERGPPAAR